MWLYSTKIKCCNKLIHSTVHFNWNNFVLCIKAKCFWSSFPMNYAEVWPLTSSPHFRVFCLSVFPEMLLTLATKWDQYRTLPEIQCRAAEPAFLNSHQHLMCTLLWNHWTWLHSILFHRTDSNQPHHNITRLRFFKQLLCRTAPEPWPGSVLRLQVPVSAWDHVSWKERI